MPEMEVGNEQRPDRHEIQPSIIYLFLEDCVGDHCNPVPALLHRNAPNLITGCTRRDYQPRVEGSPFEHCFCRPLLANALGST